MGKQKNLALGLPAEGPQVTAHNRDILKMDELVAVFISGDKKARAKAQIEILELMNSYLEKYVNLLSGAQVDIRNYDTRIFLSMFLTGRPKTYSNLSQQRSYISNVVSRLSRDDLKSEITIVFLNVLHKYRIYEGVNALNPLTKFFRFRLKDWFNRLVRDAMFKTVEIEKLFPEQNSSDNGSKLGIESIADYISAKTDSGLFETVMDIRWIANPMDPIYKQLSYYERYLVALTFGDEMSPTQIGKVLGRDKDTIKRTLAGILIKIKESLDKDSNQGC